MKIVKSARSSAALLIGVALVLFGLLADEVIEREAIFLDQPLLLFLHAHASPALDMIMLSLSISGSALVLAPLNLFIFLRLVINGLRWPALYWCLATAGTALLNASTKNIFQRDRPMLWHSISPESTFSFPSGHAMQTMAVCVALSVLIYRGRASWIWYAAAGLYVIGVGVSRSYLGVHYPSDVLAGWCLALCWVLGLTLVMRNAIFRHPLDSVLNARLMCPLGAKVSHKRDDDE